MKLKINLLVQFFILNIIIFGIVSIFIKQNNTTISKYYVFSENCEFSEFIPKYIEKNEFVTSSWQRYYGTCENGRRFSNWDMIFKSVSDMQNFDKFILSEDLHKKVFLKFKEKKQELKKSLQVYKYLKNLNITRISKSIPSTKEFELLEKRLDNLEKTIIDIDKGIIKIISIESSKNIKQIKNFKLKFSIFLSINFLIILYLTIFIFRRKQLGFYR